MEKKELEKVLTPEEEAKRYDDKFVYHEGDLIILDDKDETYEEEK